MECEADSAESTRDPAALHLELERQMTPDRIASFVPFTSQETNQTIASRFESQVQHQGGRLAVADAKVRLSYASLNDRANRICQRLLSQPGAQSAAVGLLLGHDADTIAAILGVLKAGKCYLPLDPGLPPARLNKMLADSGADTVLTHSALDPMRCAIQKENLTWINLDKLSDNKPPVMPPAGAPSDPAYLLYTSGSTGQPKGVIQTQQTVLHNVMNYTNGLHICRNDRLSLLAPFSFGASVSAIFGALLNGASLHLYDIKCKGIALLPRWLEAHRITLYHSVPTVFRELVKNLTKTESFAALRLIKLGGDTVYRSDFELYKAHFPAHCLLHVGFGTTEKNNTCQFFCDKNTRIEGATVPMGYPVPGVEVLILDDEDNPLQAQQVGKIAVRSAYLSPGYWQNSELTGAAFVTDEKDLTMRVFNTGDLGYKTAEGCLIHLGRTDHQVKVRGQRIELAEIELTLRQLDAVEDVVVVARENEHGEKRLVAYLVLHKQPGMTSEALRNHLASQLPQAMIPERFFLLDKMPLTHSGKINRQALPVPDTLSEAGGEKWCPPAAGLERAIAEIWQQVLKRERIGARDNFFHLGGHSLLATSIIARIRETFGLSISLAEFFHAPTITQLTNVLLRQAAHDRIDDAGGVDLVSIPRTEDKPKSDTFAMPVGRKSKA